MRASRITERAEDGPLVIADRPELLTGQFVAATDVKSLLLDAIFDRTLPPSTSRLLAKDLR
jgi:hypothetical protein